MPDRPRREAKNGLSHVRFFGKHVRFFRHHVRFFDQKKKKCFEKKLLIFLPVGFFSGLPLLLTSATLGTWLADIGINKTNSVSVFIFSFEYKF